MCMCAQRYRHAYKFVYTRMLKQLFLACLLSLMLCICATQKLTMQFDTYIYIHIIIVI